MKKRIKLIPPVDETLVAALVGLESGHTIYRYLAFLNANHRLLSYHDVVTKKVYPIFERLVCTLTTSKDIVVIAKVVESVIISYPRLSGIFLEVLCGLIKNSDSIEMVGEPVGSSALYVSLKFMVGVILGIFQGAIYNTKNLHALHYQVLMESGFNRKLFEAVSSVVFYPEEIYFQKYIDENAKKNIANLIKTYIKGRPLEFDLRSEVLSEIKNIRAIRQAEKKQGKKLTEMGEFLLKNIIYAYYGGYDTDEKLELIQ